ncbi:ATPase [Terribacillus sp. DMT04]|uniref:ATPase n=1 Tax=Terribacillus sp. DMT04 TaxID=2850441 RepID=UPI001C2C6BDC|nr:ATPase [Terribacillus sp. DMT04]QXE02794.1 ATPase [Terribacillus sp. DMT04]
MQIKFKSLKLQNFKSHRDLTVNFGEVTKITADNARGKSSIGEAISWLLYGIDLVGSKLDPTPVTYEADETLVSLLFNDGQKDVLLSRGLKKGKASYYINEVPSKAGDYNELLDNLFDKDLLLSLFNPNYFFTMKWTDQRAMVLQYVTAPANKEVFAALPKAQGDKLAALVKKHSLSDIDKLHRDKKKKLDKQYIAAQSKTKTLKEQLEEDAPRVPLESLQAEKSIFTKQLNEVQEVINSASSTNNQINTLNGRIKALLDERSRMQEQWKVLKAETIEDTCRTCKQPLKGDAVKAAEEDKEHRKANFKATYDKTVADRKALEAQLAGLTFIDVSEQMAKAQELQQKIAPIEAEIRNHKLFEGKQQQVKDAEQSEQQTLTDLNESIFIIDAVKAYYAKEAELQAAKVDDLLDNLSIKLFETLKNGEIKTTFEIQMDGKDYRKLSLSESIRAGLELRDVLSEQSDVITPVFVDNAESITKFREPLGQLIVSRVVAGEELNIKGANE